MRGIDTWYDLDDEVIFPAPDDDEVADLIRSVPPHFALTKSTKVLTAVGQEITLWCAGQSKVGINIPSMTGANSVSFFGSADGVTFNPITVGAYPSATPPAAGVTTVTATGSWEVGTQNYQFIRCQLTAGAGPVTVVMAASNDASYQEAFTSTQYGVSTAVIYPSTTSSAGVNTMTIPAQTGRAINLTFLEVSMSGPGGGSGAQLRIWDNAVGNGVPLYSAYLVQGVGSVGATQLINLPKDEFGNVSLLGVPGDALVIQIIGLGSLSAILNARVTYK